MVILFVVHRFHPNLSFAVRSLLDDGNCVHLIVPDSADYKSLPEDHSRCKPMMIKAEELSLSFILGIFNKLKPDIVIHRHHKGKWKLFYFASLLRSVRCITYDQNPQTGDNILEQYFRVARRLLRMQPVKKITPVLNRGRPGKFSEPFSKYVPFPIIPHERNSLDKQYRDDKTIRFLCVGKLGHKRKNYFQAIEALESVGGNVSLTIVGAGPSAHPSADKAYYDKLIDRSGRSNLLGGVNILMNVPYEDMIDVYSSHDILIMPAINEPHGQCILEALATGCPVIATDDCGASGYIKNGYSGFVYGRNNIEELCEKIRYFINKPGDIAVFGRNALLYVEEEHSPDSFCLSINKIL